MPLLRQWAPWVAKGAPPSSFPRITLSISASSCHSFGLWASVFYLYLTRVSIRKMWPEITVSSLYAISAFTGVLYFWTKENPGLTFSFHLYFSVDLIPSAPRVEITCMFYKMHQPPKCITILEGLCPKTKAHFPAADSGWHLLAPDSPVWRAAHYSELRLLSEELLVLHSEHCWVFSLTQITKLKNKIKTKS